MKTTKETKTFLSLKEGTIFEYDNVIYMKTSEPYTNCVNLVTGKLVCFADYDEVLTNELTHLEYCQTLYNEGYFEGFEHGCKMNKKSEEDKD